MESYAGRQGIVSMRRIRADEGMLLRELRLRSLADSPEAFGQTLGEARALPASEWRRDARRSSAGDSRTWLLAAVDDEIVGIVQGRRRHPGTLLLFSMWVASARRHLGLGRALIVELEAWGASWGAHETVLWVYAGNRPAIDFYQALAFSQVPSGEDHARGARFGAIAMRRDITLPQP